MIGAGTYGKIYASGNIAVKKIGHNALFSAVSEWIISRHCMHECVINYSSIDYIDNEINLTMPRYRCDLSDYISEYYCDHNRAIIVDIVRGLEYIHACGIIHGDIKPENILLDDNYCAVIADFGAAVVCQSSHHTAIQSATYRAPEVNRNYDRTSLTNSIDIWSLGCVIYEICTRTKFMLIYNEDPTIAICDRYDINRVYRTAREKALSSITRIFVFRWLESKITDLKIRKVVAGCLVTTFRRMSIKDICNILQINITPLREKKKSKKLISAQYSKLTAVDRHIASNIYASSEIKSLSAAWIIAAMLCDRVIEAIEIINNSADIRDLVIKMIIQLQDDPI